MNDFYLFTVLSIAWRLVRIVMMQLLMKHYTFDFRSGKYRLTYKAFLSPKPSHKRRITYETLYLESLYLGCLALAISNNFTLLLYHWASASSNGCGSCGMANSSEYVGRSTISNPATTSSFLGSLFRKSSRAQLFLAK